MRRAEQSGDLVGTCLGRRIRAAAVLLALLVVPAGAGDAAESRAWQCLERAIRPVARCGRAADVEELLSLASALGRPEDEVARLRVTCDKILGRVKSVTAPDADTISAVREAAASLATGLDDVETDARAKRAELAPEGVFCLIPKQALRPRTTYTVVATGLPETPPLTWHFTTR